MSKKTGKGKFYYAHLQNLDDLEREGLKDNPCTYSEGLEEGDL